MSTSHSIRSYSDRTTCPHCGDKISLEDLKVFTSPSDPHEICPTCGGSFQVSRVYQRSVVFLTFALAWFFPFLLGIRAYIVVAWIPFWLVAVALVPNLAKLAMPPRLEDETPRPSAFEQNIALFITLWLVWAVFISFEGVVTGILMEKAMFFAYLSAPLAWFDPAVAVRADTKLIVMFDTFLANTFIGAILLFPATKCFRAILRRNRPTQLHIGAAHSHRPNDD